MLSFECIKNEKSVYFLLTSAFPACFGQHTRRTKCDDEQLHFQKNATP